MPGIGAIERRRLVQVRADGLQPCKQRDREERHTAPGVDQHRAPHRPVPIRKERQAIGDHAAVKEHPVHHAECRVEHPAPGKRGKHCRDDEGKQHGGADDPLEAEAAVEHQRQPHAQGQLEDGGPERVEDRVLERGLEYGVVPGLGEVCETHELARIADPDAGERKPQRHHEWVGDEEHENDHARREQGRREQILAFQQARQARNATALGGGRHARGAPRSGYDGILQGRSIRCKSCPARSRPT